MYTISQAAKKLGISRVAVFHLVRGKWQEHCQRLGDGKFRATAWIIPADLVESYRPRKRRKKKPQARI